MNNYYVYLHVDPRDDRIKYVGMGQGQRAWMMRNSGGATRYGHRNKEHYAWFKELEALGYTLDQIVVIEHKQLSKEEALKLEKEIVEESDGGQLFNVNCKQKWKTNNKDLILKTKELRDQGLSYKKIGIELGRDTMTCWRAANA